MIFALHNFSIHDIQQQDKVGYRKIQLELQKITCFSIHSQNNSIAFAHQNSRIQSKDIYQVSLFQYSEKQFNLESQFNGCLGKILKLCFSKKITNLFAGDEKGRVYCWHIETKNLIFQSQENEGLFCGIQSFQNDENEIVTWHQKQQDHYYSYYYQTVFIKWNTKKQTCLELNMLEQEQNNIFSFSPSGYYLASYCRNNFVLQMFVYDSERQLYNSENIQILQDYIKNVDVLTFTSDGKFLLLINFYYITLWNVEQKLIQWNDQQCLMKDITLTPNQNFEKQILMFNQNSTVFLISLGKNYQLIDYNHYVLQSKEQIIQFQFLDKDSILFITDSGSLLMLNKQNFEDNDRFYFKKECRSPKLTKKQLLINLSDQQIQIYDLQKKELIDNIIDEYINSKLQLFPDESYFISFLNQKFCFIQIENYRNISSTKWFKFGCKSVNSVEISQNSLLMASTHELKSSQLLIIRDISEKNEPKILFVFQEYLINFVGFTFDSNLLFVITDIHCLCFNIKKSSLRQCDQIIFKHKLIGIEKYFSKNEEELFLLLTSKVIYSTIDFSENALSKKNIIIQFSLNPIQYTFSNTTQKLAYIDECNQTYLYQLNDSKFIESPTYKFSNQNDIYCSLCLSHNGQFLLLGGKNKSLSIWCSQQYKKLVKLNNLNSKPLILAFSPDCLHFVAGTNEGSIGFYISNVLNQNNQQSRAQTKLLECLKNKPKIGCLKLFSQQQYLQVYNCNFDQRDTQKSNDQLLAKLIEQKQKQKKQKT